MSGLNLREIFVGWAMPTKYDDQTITKKITF
jgi:hypothetical protein